MKVNIIITQQQYNQLRQKLLPPGDQNEHFAFGLAGVSRYHRGYNLLLRDFVTADFSCLSDQSGVGVRPEPIFIDYVWTLAKKSNSALIDIHTHPFANENVTFSSIDDHSEIDSFPKAVEYLGKGPHASIVLGTNSLDARWYNTKTKNIEPIDSIKIIGENLITITPTSALRSNPTEENYQAKEMYDRQVRVFGQDGQRILQTLTVGIVGAGGIGSMVCVLLSRLGAGRLIIIDPDIVEKSNLNRLAASTTEDANKKTPKVLMLKRYIERITSDIKIVSIYKSIHEEGVLEILKSCDVIFGCTDNHSTRWLLNKFSIEHLIPYFDTGTGIQASPNQKVEHAGGQVRVVIPDMGCLNCIDGIDISTAQQEMLPESDRQVALQLGYIAGADFHAPAVASLNGVIANLTVTEFMAFVTGLRPVHRYIFYDFIKAEVTCEPFKKTPDCFTCSKTGSFAIGDKGYPLPADMLIYEPKIEKNKGEKVMEERNLTISEVLENLLSKAKESGFDIEVCPEGCWFLLKNIKIGKPFSRPKTDVLVKFLEDSHDPIMLVPENLGIDDSDKVCQNFLSKSTYLKGWKSLCPHMFQNVTDELLQFISCLTGFMTNPSLCGLMGCEGKKQK